MHVVTVNVKSEVQAGQKCCVPTRRTQMLESWVRCAQPKDVKHMVFHLKGSPNYKSICKLRWHQFHKTNELPVSFYLLRKTCRTALLTYSVALQPWRAQAWVSVSVEQVANLLPQHLSESARFNNQSHLVAKQENITGEKQVRKSGRHSISLMLCRVLLHAVNLRHGTDGFTSPPKEVRAKNPPSSVGFEPATECPVGPVASTNH
jgi:hypothetical protein